MSRIISKPFSVVCRASSVFTFPYCPQELGLSGVPQEVELGLSSSHEKCYSPKQSLLPEVLTPRKPSGLCLYVSIRDLVVVECLVCSVAGRALEITRPREVEDYLLARCVVAVTAAGMTSAGATNINVYCYNNGTEVRLNTTNVKNMHLSLTFDY